MSQLNDAPERDDNEIGNDSASEVAGSAKNLNDTINNYNEGQKAQESSGDSGDKSDNGGDSNNSEKPNNSDGKDTSDASGSSNATGADNPSAPNASDNPSNNTNNNEQNPDAPQQTNNQNGANGQPANSQPSGTPQGNDSNVGDTPKVSSGPKPGDVAGESGGGVSTNAGTIKPPSSAVSNGSQATPEGAQTVKQGAEAAKQAGEVAQAAAEGSVVPGAGTVAVAAARTAWALRHTIAKLVMVVILVIAILSSAIESLPGIIWNQAFDEDGNEVETSVEEVYADLVTTVQDFVNEAYTESVIKAVKEYDKGTVVEIDGESVNLNELNTPLLGDGIGDETVDKDGNKQYKYNIGTDICEIIAHFTVKCKLENKEPTKENLLKYLKKGKDDLFEVTIEDKFEKDGAKKKLKKLVYVEYKQAPQYRLDTLGEVTMVMSALHGAWWKEENQEFIYYLVDNPRISEEGYLSLCDNYNAVTGSFIKYSSPDGSISFPIAGDITKVYYSNFTAIGDETRTSVTGVSKNAYYEYHKTGIVSSEDYENENTGDVGNNKFRYVVSKRSGLDYTERDQNVIQAYGNAGFYFMKRDQGMSSKSISDYGIDYEKITVSSLNRSALTECFEIDKNEPYPLVADYTGEDVTKDDGTTEKKWSVSQNYTPETFTCGMAISSYVEILRSCLYGTNGENITIAPAEPVKRYEIIVTTESGAKVSGAKVVVKYKGKKVATVKTDSDGLAVYEGNKNKNYTFEVSDEYQTTVTSKVTYGNFAKHNESNFICPLQTSGENQWVNITSMFGNRIHPVTGVATPHGGLDMVVLLKDTNESITQGYPVRAVADGEVIYSGEGSGYGYYVHIQHEGGTQTLYAHNSVLCVKEGDEIKQGQIIAYAGNTGVSTGPHLHFEVRVYEDGAYKRKDPLNYIPIVINN